MDVVSRWLYLPGLGTGVHSVKGAAIGAMLRGWGLASDTVDLRVPEPRDVRVGAMVQAVRAAAGRLDERVVLFGTSLGGHVAVRVAAEDPRVAALVLLAPVLDPMAVCARYPWTVRTWRAFGRLPLRDKTDRRWHLLRSGLLMELMELGPVPYPRVPTLIVHGVADRRVDIDQSRGLVRGGGPVRLVEIDDDHDLSRSLPEVLHAISAFLEPWLSRAPVAGLRFLRQPRTDDVHGDAVVDVGAPAPVHRDEAARRVHHG